MLTVRKQDKRPDYAPPLTGNGDIAVYSDIEHKSSYIWWAGHRYMDSFRRDLVPFGKTVQYINGVSQPADWQQSLDTDKAHVESLSCYGDIKAASEEFVHAEHNILAFRKRFSCQSSFKYNFSYIITGPSLEGKLPRRFVYSTDAGENTISIKYAVDGQEQYSGVIMLICSCDKLKPAVNGNTFSFEGEISDEEIYFFLTFGDYGTFDYAALKASHEKLWSDYYSEGYVKIGDDKAVEDAYKTALYHLKCYTTKWSVPVGLNDTHWHSKFFAFDEYFSYMGLLTGNHISLAGRVPEFRYKGLAKAVSRASSKGINEARYPWETVETGDEASPYGFWYEHIFHMSHVSLGAWEYYNYTGGREFLRSKGYPMIKACCEFFLRHMVYRNYGRAGRTVIGKCTDLERLGSSVENAFMTTCSVISALNCCAKAADVLGIDSEYACECRETAAELKANLPHDGEKYVPYPECPQSSIAVMSGTFYNVLPADDIKQIKALESFCEHELEFGNMYAYGHKVSPWYALWKAITYTRWRSREKACEAVYQALESVGGFSEMFEINEPSHRVRPWFTTASGIYLHTTAEMLIQSEGDTVYLMPSVPAKWRNCAFRLRAKNDIVVEAEIKDGNVVKLKIEKGSNCPYERINIITGKVN